MNVWNLYSNELYHFQIKGAKWGYRRFQNEDGTWTEEGLRRRRITENGGATIEKGAKYGKQITSVNKDISNISNASRNLIRDTDSQIINPFKYSDTLRGMTDDDIRKRVNRMTLEDQYTRLQDSRDSYASRKGKETVSQILNTVGDIATITGGVVSAAIMIQVLRSGGF